MATIKAPFNFVPLSDKVFTPDWADKVSHDIPFEDGLDGSIDVTITTHSPIFVRNGKKTNEEDNTFCHTDDGRYFIPGTTVKGAIRNVLEILSCGKMETAKKRYAIRDLQLKEYTNHFVNNYDNIHGGWLSYDKDVDEISIIDSGVPYRVSHIEIDNYFNTHFVTIFSKKENFKSGTTIKSAKYKYDCCKGQKLVVGYKVKGKINSANTVDKREIVTFDSNSAELGTLVFTGQPGHRKAGDKSKNQKAQSKFYEFVFAKNREKSTPIATFDYYEDEGLWADFRFIYADSEEWGYWKSKLLKGERIPVFLTLNADGTLKHFGLSYLYKLPYVKRVDEYRPMEHTSTSVDFVDSLFGYANKDEALKGRVQFSHAFCVADNVKPMHLHQVLMSSPKPTYYPIYVKQEGGSNGFMSDVRDNIVKFRTMLNSDVQLRGWKVYPIHKQTEEFPAIEQTQLINSSKFYPLPIGTEFKFTINFHNIRPFELGALLSAIKLQQNSFHNLGFAKPYGYGKCKLMVSDLNLFEESDVKTQEEYIALFNEQMKAQDNKAYGTIIREFFAMMSEQELTTSLEYMQLEDFVSCKRQSKATRNKDAQYGEYLQPYTELIKRDISKKPQKESIVLDAVICMVKPVRKVKLLSGPDIVNSFELEVSPYYRKPLKEKDKVQVKVELKGGKIKKVILVEK
jgi:CRISPR-associated protein (TIGR03986 family)